MKRVKWIALALVAALCLPFTGCIGNLYENAGTINGHDISSGLYLMAQYSAYTQAQNLVEDPETDVLKQSIDGVKAKDWIKAETEEALRKYIAILELCREKGITLNSDGQANIEQLMQYWPYMEEVYAENGISEATMQRYTTNEQLSTQLFSALYAEGGELYTPEQELMDAYGDVTAHVRFISAPVNTLPAEGEGDAVDMSEEVTAITDQMVADLESGAKTMEELAQEDLVKAYDLLDRTFDQENALNNLSTSYISLYPDNYDTYTEEFLEHLKGQSVGDYGSYNMGSTVIVYQKIDTFTEEDDFESMRDTVLSAVKKDEYDEYLKSIYDGYEVEWAPGARAYLRVGKIVE